MITGAAGGIGQAIVQAFTAKGASVIATDIEPCEASRFEPCNLMDLQETSQLWPRAEQHFGRIDILVNNAGINILRPGILMRDADFEMVMRVNLTASFVLCRAALQRMPAHGRIITISSVIGVTGNVSQSNYAASKAAMMAMTKTLALEAAPKNITVTCVAPGFIDTNMIQWMPEGIRRHILRQIPQGRWGSVSDVAAACVFLASQEAAYLTGQTLHVNGGLI